MLNFYKIESIFGSQRSKNKKREMCVGSRWLVPMTLSEVVEMEKGGKVPNKTSESCLKNL